MGREVRRVNLNFKHPQKPNTYYENPYKPASRLLEPGMTFAPMLDRKFSEALDEWEREKEDYIPEQHGNYSFEEWYGERPDPDYHLPDEAFEEPLGYCLYETVSEGTPTTPVFGTEEELIEWLVTYGQDYDQVPMRPEAAEKLVRAGWAPSLMVIDNQVYDSSDLDKIDKALEGRNEHN